MWTKRPFQNRSLTPPHSQIFHTAGGTPLEVLGTFDYLFIIDGSLYPFRTYVIANLSHDVIIGKDFIFNFAKTIDFQNFQLHFSPPSQPLYDGPASTSFSSSSNSLQVPDQLTVLPLRTETIFPVPCSFSPGSIGIFSPHPQLITKYQLIAANILCTVSENQTVPFRILHTKTTLGTIDCSDEISSIQIVELINSSSQPSSFPQNTWGPQCNFYI